MGCRDGGSDFFEEKCGAGQYSGTEPCRPLKISLVGHGYDLTDDGGLGANELICLKIVELWKSGRYERVILPAGVNEKTGEGKPLLWELQADYLVRHGVPRAKIVSTYEIIASDTATEVAVACHIAFPGFVEAVGFFPHSWKIYRCWQRRYQQGKLSLIRLHHVFGFVGLAYLLKNAVSFGVGLFDPLGKHWPAKVVKQRRRDLYTPAHLRDKVIF